jgi:hypothetical protein
MLVLAGVLFLSACVAGAGFSSDPMLAAKQQWIAGCKTADANIRTATVLYKAGQLSESAADAMDDVVDLYEVVCTVDPPDPGVPIASLAIKVLAGKVCPSLVPSNVDDWTLTLAEAASCAAEGALLAEAGQ